MLWGVELTSPTYLVRAGWKSNTIKPGDKVTVVVNPVRSGEPAGIFRVADAGRRPRAAPSGRRVSARLIRSRPNSRRRTLIMSLDVDRSAIVASAALAVSACTAPAEAAGRARGNYASRGERGPIASREAVERAGARQPDQGASGAAVRPHRQLVHRREPRIPNAWRFGPPYPKLTRGGAGALRRVQEGRRPKARSTATTSASAGRPACRSS